MSKINIDVIIIGAGPAGLSLSFYLQKYGLQHLVLEKSQLYSQWYNRFDHFHVNTASWMNQLPGDTEIFEDKNHLQQAPHQLVSRQQALEY